MDDRNRPRSTGEARQFDFWLGEWNLSWPAEQTGGAPGEIATGANTITTILDGCVIEEDFATSDGAFRGHSLSVYDRTDGVWRQTWVDNTGGYLLFTGGFDGDTMDLRTEPTNRDGEQVVNRMVFSEIEADSLSWSWQRSRDSGKSWHNIWTISYRRRAGTHE